MSTCISPHGEYGEHDLPGTKFSEFDCNRCYAFVEDAALAEVERLRAKVTRVEALKRRWWLRRGESITAPTWQNAARELDVALAEPDRAEEGSND